MNERNYIYGILIKKCLNGKAQSTEIRTEKELYNKYPNSMFILQDGKEQNEVKGILLAISYR